MESSEIIKFNETLRISNSGKQSFFQKLLNGTELKFAYNLKIILSFRVHMHKVTINISPDTYFLFQFSVFGLPCIALYYWYSYLVICTMICDWL